MALNTSTPAPGFRADIQGLRAVAVLLVVAFHLYPNRVSGGYVGVDVFFVLSGFLITSHIDREIETTGRLSLSAFWARRIRRLLPASFLVLAVSTIATWAWLPSTLWDQTLRQLLASVLYLQNWALASDAVDYSASGNDPTLVQHFWSLAVEEQFYVLWPLLAVVVVVAVRSRGPVAAHRGLGLSVLGVAIASFAYSVVATAHDPARAYFVTPTRAWEFAAGALLALVGPIALPGAARVVAGWAGLIAVVGSALAFDESTAFPGWIALVPVIGSVAVLAAGPDSSRWSASRPLSWRPATFVGDISYAVYLWHWPLIVLAPHITGTERSTRHNVGIFVLTMLVSWVSTRWIEQPARSSSVLTATARRSYAFGAAGMIIVAVGVLGLQGDLDRRVHAADAAYAAVVGDALAGDEPCIGPAVLDPAYRDRHGCLSVSGTGAVTLNPAAVARQNSDPVFPECQSSLDGIPIRSCELGDTQNPTRTVAIVGDSHATHWFSALDELGRQHGWLVRTYTRSSCPFTDARRTLPDEPTYRYERCRDANAEVERRLLADTDLDLVLVSSYSSAYGWEDEPDRRFPNPAIDGFRQRWRRLVDGGLEVVILRDVPTVKDKENTPDCLVRNEGRPLACASTRSEALVPDVAADAASSSDATHLVDLSDRFCDESVCHAVVGDVIVYRDYSHLSREYSTLLAPYLVQELRNLGLA